jgi:hypothetical protein
MQIKNPVVAATYSSILSAEMAQSELGAQVTYDPFSHPIRTNFLPKKFPGVP